MTAALDPTFPLYPIACLLSSAMLFLVILTSFVRQSWNLGVAFLCFWLFFETLAAGSNAIIWADNDDVKLYVYCDIYSHLQIIVYVVKPMATLIITRRLHLITSLQSVELPTSAAKRRNFAIEWTLGLIIPVLVAGPFYYVVQWPRFQVYEGFGCADSPDGSILDTLLITSWSVTLPLVSVLVYYPRVVRTFYRQNRDINHFLRSNSSLTRRNYFRILALASIDILLTLPIGVVVVALNMVESISQNDFPFYPGWTYDHTEWAPEGLPYAELLANGTFSVAQLYFTQWSSPILAFAIFGLFGVTSEARASYWCIICRFGGWIGWKPAPRAHKADPSLGEIKFGERPPQGSMSLGLDSHPSFIKPDARPREQVPENKQGHVASEAESGSEKHVIEEVLRSSSNDVAEASAQQYESYSTAIMGAVDAV